MKKWKKVTLIFLAIGLIAGAIVFYVATKKPKTAADSKPIKEMLATDLINELSNNQHATDSAYMFKNIAVKGKVKEINGTNIIIEAGESAFVNCSFDSTAFEVIKNTIKSGAEVNIKGIYYGCSGFDPKSDDDLDLMPIQKEAKLKTCGINSPK
jgi:hypothetical protein